MPGTTEKLRQVFSRLFSFCTHPRTFEQNTWQLPLVAPTLDDKKEKLLQNMILNQC